MMSWDKVAEQKKEVRSGKILSILLSKFTVFDYMVKMQALKYDASLKSCWGDLLHLERINKIKRVGDAFISSTEDVSIHWAKIETETEPSRHDKVEVEQSGVIRRMMSYVLGEHKSDFRWSQCEV